MSLYVMVDFNNDIKQKLYEKQLTLKQSCSGDFETFDCFHITVKYLNDEDEQLDLAVKAMHILDDMKYKQFEIIAKNFGNFNKSVHWVGVHNCFNLYKIKYDVEKCFNDVNYEIQPEKFNGYTPHITMGYNVAENKPFNKEFEGIPIIVDNICLWQSYKVNDVYMQNCLYRVNLR